MLSSLLPPLTQTEMTDVRALNARFQSWLHHSALPLWSSKGPDHEYGGFFETIGLNGEPCLDNKRVRVTARQIYCFAMAAQMNWAGDVTPLMTHGWAFLNGIGARGDGPIKHILTREGAIVNAGPDLYDQAFVLLAHRRRCSGIILCAEPAPLRLRCKRTWAPPPSAPVGLHLDNRPDRQ